MARFSSDSSSGKETTVEGEGEEDLNSEESTGFDHIEEERQEIKDDHDTTKNQKPNRPKSFATLNDGTTSKTSFAQQSGARKRKASMFQNKKVLSSVIFKTEIQMDFEQKLPSKQKGEGVSTQQKVKTNVEQFIKDKMHQMQTNPVREAIDNFKETNQYARKLLEEELQILEKLQPRDANINIRNVSSFEYFAQKLYNPKENIQNIYQLTALAFIMSADNRIGKSLVESQYFEFPLLSDIKYILKEVPRIDPDFLRLVFRFTAKTLTKDYTKRFNKTRGEIRELLTLRAIENVENLKIEDLAYISEVCRYQDFNKDIQLKFVQAIKPLIMEYQETEAYTKSETAITVLAKFAQAICSTHKYSNEEPELWQSIVEMLVWSLKSQSSGEKKLIPMDTLEFTKLVTSLSRRRETSLELWSLLAKELVTQMNSKKLNVQDLMIITRSLVNAKIRSEKLYGFIVSYFLKAGIDERTSARMNHNTPVFFFISLAKALPTLCDNDQLFAVVNTYLQRELSKLDQQQCEVCLDTWKLNQNFINDETKAMLIERKNELMGQQVSDQD